MINQAVRETCNSTATFLHYFEYPLNGKANVGKLRIPIFVTGFTKGCPTCGPHCGTLSTKHLLCGCRPLSTHQKNFSESILSSLQIFTVKTGRLKTCFLPIFSEETKRLRT